MGFINQSKSNSEGWGMGFLLVFFPEEDQNQESNTNKKKPNTQNPFSPSSSSFKRSNSSHLIYRAQSTISICLLLLFTTLLLFTLSTLPSATTTAAARRLYRVPRRGLSSRPPQFSSNLSHALQGMGTLYRRGTRAMGEIVVAHAVESLTEHELRTFLRVFHRSPIASKSDLLIVFPSRIAAFDAAILEENDSFLKLLTRYKSSNVSHSTASFDLTQFTKLSKKEKESGEPIWGRRIRSTSSGEGETELTRLSYGSVVGFDVEELDPENSLSGFMDHVSMSLRRWACYPMLLGRVRRNFKHVMLVDVKEFLVLGDPLGRVRNQSPESVLLKAMNQSAHGKHGKKNSDRTHPTRAKSVHSGVLLGGSRGIRRLSSAMLTEIVRAAMQQHKKKNPVGESTLFNQLVGNDYVLKDVNLIVSTESVTEVSSPFGSSSKSGSHNFLKNHSLIRRGNNNLDVNSMLMKHLCSFAIDSTVYSDCH